ncbi:MAG: Fic family protein [Coriobacteriales bacterium]|jgi:hypothetical protein|nr:Fic family protein [Coriobacteriales bacterium]
MSAVYQPQPIETSRFLLRDDTAAELYECEREMIRAEHTILNSPYRFSLSQMLAHIETVSSSWVDGDKPDLIGLLRLENIVSLHGTIMEWSNQQIRETLANDGCADPQAVLESYRYMRTFEWMGRTFDRKSVITPELLLRIRRLCLVGPDSIDPAEKLAYRTHEFSIADDNVAEDIYQPPHPDELLHLVRDYCDFVSKDTFTPTAQAALSHFQLEAIKPFENKMDRIDRLMSHAIYFRRETLKSVALPLGLLPAMHTREHVRALMPYNLGVTVENVRLFMVQDKFVDYCAACAMLSAEVVAVCIDVVEGLEESWRDRIGRIGRDSTLERLLWALPGMPVISVRSAMQVTQKSFSSVNDAIKTLLDFRILQPGRSFKHDRMFEAPEAVAALRNILESLLPEQPIVRDEFYRKRKVAPASSS